MRFWVPLLKSRLKRQMEVVKRLRDILGRPKALRLSIVEGISGASILRDYQALQFRETIRRFNSAPSSFIGTSMCAALNTYWSGGQWFKFRGARDYSFILSITINILFS